MSKCEQCIIRQFNSLKSLTKNELIRIASCKTSKVIKKGSLLFEEGEHINGVFCIKSGISKVSKMSDNGRDQIVNIVQKGDLLGERSLITDEASNLKAIAINDMEVCFIPKEEILNNLETNPKFTMDVLKNMASSLKLADNFIVDMAQKTVKQRLATTLLNLEKKFEKNKNGALDILLSREDIANIIGTATESAIRLLSEFKKKKLIDLKGKEVFILNISELEKISKGL
ncbi:Crp/Fnr family transcriptional regulator [Tenacibaculum piscium]|uniref:Crp/Fnr family transcriptional regulator n=3 Tax=Tenacibaculum piscium TaxID=1458515 RepID=A0A2H1YFR3_9FLAO|nr:Crp/Fnr family transcriptional regulator [Tenacibaculum piscium]MBE7629041.1 cyclic nucleotide-binding domain-containing protein [Tenacibaculum piscium]MBE7670485.1 cyclic nucleotide-binding domain-containing protein [Tenacibaculum piscium]MBE7684938.1 cyclic nucleotide-binding domain-containing protein [Tenacibaculum piscium]MBE7689641.1 cyclic nucleotide-binding domain-containing protein [Tenacibaculum piscium]SOS74201.1 Crp/Fnr family transcriptional regulator [Tenacibaculum piscium]